MKDQMKHNFFLIGLVLTAIILSLTLNLFSADKPLWVHPSCQTLDIAKKGPFVLMAHGALATVDEKGFYLSYDGGRSWSEPVFVCSGLNSKEPASYYLLRTKNNVLILVYLNFNGKKFSWDQEKNEPAGDCQL
jgi:hypothetical protein